MEVSLLSVNVSSWQSKEGGGLGVMTAGPKKTAEDPKPDPVVGTQRLDPKSQTKPKGKLRRKAEPPKIILSPLEVIEIYSSVLFSP